MNNNIVEIKGKKLCAYCFSNLSLEEACSSCIAPETIEGALPSGTILKGKYLVGGSIYYDSSYYGYYGYDLAESRRVIIREFFPEGSYCRRVKKDLVYDVSDSAMLELYRKAVSDFHTDVKLMSSLKNNSVVLNIVNLFDENGTSYCVHECREDAVVLSEHIRKNGGALEPKEALSIFDAAMTSLNELHGIGIMH